MKGRERDEREEREWGKGMRTGKTSLTRISV